MKKSTITKEMAEMISRGDQKAEIFAELLQLFGLKYQNLISQIMHFEYDYLREKYDPERGIRRDISMLLETYKTKGAIYEQLYKKYGQKNALLITAVLEKDYDSLKQEQQDGERMIQVNDQMDYTVFFSLNEKIKVTNKQRYDYRVTKEFVYEDKVLVGEIEIKRGKLFVGAYSFYENEILTVFNFITVLNAVFKDYFVLALSNMLSIEMMKRIEQSSHEAFSTTIHNKKMLLKGVKGYAQEESRPKEYLLDIFYTVDPEMLSMTIIGEQYQQTA